MLDEAKGRQQLVCRSLTSFVYANFNHGMLHCDTINAILILTLFCPPLML